MIAGNRTLFDKMRDVKAMQYAMAGKTIKPQGKSGFVSGGKWEVVQEFKGKSHAQGGIDLEVGDGYVRRIDVAGEADDVAKNGRFWKNLGAAAYGVGEGLLDTITLGATDQLTDLGYNALQKVGGSTADEMREQNSIRGYGTTAGAITGAVLTGGATTGSAIQQGAKGVGAGVSAGSPDSKAAQAIGTYLPLAGNIAGMAVGNVGYGKGIDAATKGAEAAKEAGDLGKAAQLSKKAEMLGKFSNVATKAGKIAPYNTAIQAINTGMAQPEGGNLGGFQQAIRATTPFISPSTISTFGQYKNALSEAASQQRGVVDGYARGSDDTSIFWNQPTIQQEAMEYLNKQGVNG